MKQRRDFPIHRADAPAPDMSMCSPDHLTPPDAPSKRADRLATLFFLALILLLWLLGAWLDNWGN